MDASYYKVEVQIGGRTRTLVCSLGAAEEIRRETGRNPLHAGGLFVDATGALCAPGDIAIAMAALLRETEPEVDAKVLLKEMELYRLPAYMEAIAHAMAGPDFGKEAPPEANPPQADPR